MWSYYKMTDLDMKLPEDIPPPLSNPSDEHNKGMINDVLNQKQPEPEEDDPEITAPMGIDAPILVVKEILQDEEVFKDVPPPEKRPKKKASAKQLEHLAKAREKASINRKAKAELKRVEKQKVRDTRDLKKSEVEQKSVSFEESYPTFQQFSPDDIIKLQEDAISNYDARRKKRKEDKKKKQQVQAVEKKNYEAVTRAIHKPTNPDPDDVWALCFN
jgi:hypothetical protein